MVSLFTFIGTPSALVILAVFLNTVVLTVLSVSLVGIVIDISLSFGRVTLNFSFCPSVVSPTPVASLSSTLLSPSAVDLIRILSLSTVRPSGITSSTFMSLVASRSFLFLILRVYVIGVSFSFVTSVGAASVPVAGFDSLCSSNSGL